MSRYLDTIWYSEEYTKLLIINNSTFTWVGFLVYNAKTGKYEEELEDVNIRFLPDDAVYIGRL